ncbi:MAG: peptidoglycan DD-metalloendopeptidase family protein [Xanthomonadales bacterium]|nr:peptidoglycan DD-metalloendopeptidase family protein [Xanthomonadales bacterium]
MIYEPRSSHPLRDPQHPQAQRKPGTTLPVATSASSSTGRSIAGRLLAAMGAALIVIGSGAMLDPARAKVNENENQLAPRLEVPLLLPSADEVEVLPLAYVPALEHDLFTRGMGDDGWSVVTVRRNETLGDIFARLGMGGAEVHRVVGISEHTQSLVQIHPGDQIAFRVADGRLQGMQFDLGEDRRVLIESDGNGFVEQVIERRIETRLEYASGTIRSSLFQAGSDAGVADRTILKMAEVLNYDIDFALDLRGGDHFTVVYQGIYRDGVRLRDGDIVAVRFVNQGKTHEAFRFVNAQGQPDYYDSEGRSLRKAFIRTPVEFTRISSRFSSARKHPILGRVRAHKGVDYAAPAGTVIRAAGTGTVKFVGRMNGYGNVVELQHGRETTTLYAHMSRFAPGLKKGQKITQGQTIGYVGKTGLATAPHLHYEFRVKGVHRDPLSVTMPRAEPLLASELQRFRGELVIARTQLTTLEGALAMRAAP